MFLGAFAWFLNCTKREKIGFFVGRGGGRGGGQGLGPGGGERVAEVGGQARTFL